MHYWRKNSSLFCFYPFFFLTFVCFLFFFFKLFLCQKELGLLQSSDSFRQPHCDGKEKTDGGVISSHSDGKKCFGWSKTHT